MGPNKLGVPPSWLCVAWQGVSDFTIDRCLRADFPAGGPAVHGSAPRYAWQPPTAELFEAVVQVLAASLPEETPALPIPWYRRRAALLGALAAVTLPFVLVGIGVYVAEVPWSWVYYTAAAALAMILGQVVVKRFQLG
jgi:hypothetical protein